MFKKSGIITETLLEKTNVIWSNDIMKKFYKVFVKF